MTTEAASGPMFIGGELVAAPSAHPRVVLDDLIDLILRLELASRAPMPILASNCLPIFADIDPSTAT